MTICAIHQPNFFPWLGYFDKIARSDVFVFLDSVKYPRAGSGGMGSYSNRVKIAQNQEAVWFGAPVSKKSSSGLICEARFADQPWREALLNKLKVFYRKAPAAKDMLAIIEPLLLNETESLSEFNISSIVAISQALGQRTKFIRQSELATTKASTELLIEIVQGVDATTYLAGGGAGGYQEDDQFACANIDLVYQNFSPMPYGDPTHFIPGLSIIDYLAKR
jgi:hypothetical protein